MFDSLGKDHHLAFIQMECLVFQIDLKTAVNDYKDLIGFRTFVPYKFSFRFDQFEMVVVHLRDYFVSMQFIDLLEFFLEIDHRNVHCSPLLNG